MLCSPVEPASRKGPLHHFRIGKWCKSFGAELRQQAIELNTLPSVVLEPSLTRENVSERQMLDEGQRRKAVTGAMGEERVGHFCGLA